MAALRILLRRHHLLAVTLLILALLAKAAIPSGIMVAPSATKLLQVTVCAEMTGKVHRMTIAVPMEPGSGEPEREPTGDCAFSTLAKLATGGADPLLLAALLGFILLLGTARVTPLPQRRGLHLRPPLRGPPRLI